MKSNEEKCPLSSSLTFTRVSDWPEKCGKPLITRNLSHITSRIPHANEVGWQKWLPDVVKKCMGSKLKSQFLTVHIK